MGGFFKKQTLDPRIAYTDAEKERAKQAALGIAAGSGMILSQSNNLLEAGAGGAMTGFAAGGPLGALLGLGFGLIGAGRRGMDQAANRRMLYDHEISSKASQPSYFAEHGGIVDDFSGDMMIKTQGKKGEVAALPDGSIVDLHATKKEHKDYKKGEPQTSDNLPAGTFIGDDTKIKLKDAKKIVLGAEPGIYKEYGKGTPYKDILLSDALGTKEQMTTAEALNKIKKHIPVSQDIENEVDDHMARITTAENLQTRGKYISGLLELASKNNKLLKKQLANGNV